MIEDVLRKIARQIMALNEDCLIPLLPKYKERMLNFTPTSEWEEAILIYYFINGLRIKNSQFNDKIKEYMMNTPEGEQSALGVRPKLRLVKSSEKPLPIEAEPEEENP
jgi:hypothetical protein